MQGDKRNILQCEIYKKKRRKKKRHEISGIKRGCRKQEPSNKMAYKYTYI